jgi:phosphatidylinositol dimannoside acyltransferase
MTSGERRRDVGRRLRAACFATGAHVLARLPERPLLWAADVLGSSWYRLAPGRRRVARRNLARVTRWMRDHELGAPEDRAAAEDPRALERLVRKAFRHSVRYYVQLSRAEALDSRYLERWLAIDTPEIVQAAVTNPGGSLFVSLHLGWYELPALLLAELTRRPAVVPTEVLADPYLQAFMVESRRRLGVNLIAVTSARSQLVAAIRDGSAVGIMGDRDITGGGIVVPFFGHPARLPSGPALLALELGATPWVFGSWRADDGVFHVRGSILPLPEVGTRRERVTAWLAAEARLFEGYVAEAPEQWLAIFHPIWLEQPDARAARRAAKAAA